MGTLVEGTVCINRIAVVSVPTIPIHVFNLDFMEPMEQNYTADGKVSEHSSIRKIDVMNLQTANLNIDYIVEKGILVIMD